MANKFTKTDDLKEEFDQEKVRLSQLQAMLQKYKPGLNK